MNKNMLKALPLIKPSKLNKFQYLAVK